MTKELVIERFRATRKKLRYLKAKNFKYDSYTTFYSEKNICDSICCVLGWYPVWFPKSGLYYRCGLECPGEEVVSRYIDKWHGISYELCLALFYGDTNFQENYGLPIVDKYSTLTQVRNLLKVFYEKLKAGDFDDQLILN